MADAREVFFAATKFSQSFNHGLHGFHGFDPDPNRRHPEPSEGPKGMLDFQTKLGSFALDDEPSGASHPCYP